MVVTIVVIVGIVVVGVGILAYRNRTEKGIESGITSFRRELHALAPRTDEESRAAGDRLADQGSATATGAEPDAAVETSDTDTDPEPETDTDPEPETVSETEPETEADSETETEPRTETGTEPETEADPSERPDA